MKQQFFDIMHHIMEQYPDVYFLMAGLGYPRVDEFLAKYPERAFNTEASEQATLDIAVGLAYSGKIPIVYSITPFLLYRGFETIRTYINHEALPVILIGAGRDDDYSKHDGFSHYAGDDISILQPFSHISILQPNREIELREALYGSIMNRQPTYINLKR
jgi:transketolase